MSVSLHILYDVILTVAQYEDPLTESLFAALEASDRLIHQLIATQREGGLSDRIELYLQMAKKAPYACEYAIKN